MGLSREIMTFPAPEGYKLRWKINLRTGVYARWKASPWEAGDAFKGWFLWLHNCFSARRWQTLPCSGSVIFQLISHKEHACFMSYPHQPKRSKPQWQQVSLFGHRNTNRTHSLSLCPIHASSGLSPLQSPIFFFKRNIVWKKRILTFSYTKYEDTVY